MRPVTIVALWIVRLAGATQLVLGSLIWFGVGANFVKPHIAIGMLLVLALWTLAIVGLASRQPWPLPVFTILWGAALPALGMPQATFLVGPLHWIIRVGHLFMGAIAIALGQKLAHRRLTMAHGIPSEISGSDVSARQRILR